MEGRLSWTETSSKVKFNPLNSELNPISHMLALLGAHPILHVSRIRVKLPSQCLYLVGVSGDSLYLFWRSWDRASWYISVVKPTRCTIFVFIEYQSTCFGRSLRPSSGVYDCAHSSRYMLLASGHEMQFHLVPASKQATNLYDVYQMLCVQSWTPDDGREDRPKHVDWYSVNSKNCAFRLFYCRNIALSCCLLVRKVDG
jgi:hypothetical protein